MAEEGRREQRRRADGGQGPAPKDRILSFVDSFVAAFKAGNWDITTAKSKIVVGKDGKWRQIVTPDLGKDERIGFYMKTGPGQREFSESTLHSEDPEIIYGWTEPDTVTNKRDEKRGLVVIITEIDVTAADAATRSSRPGPTRWPRRSCTRSASTPAVSRRAAPTCTATRTPRSATS